MVSDGNATLALCSLFCIIHFHYYIFNFGSFLQKTHKCKSCRSRQELSNEYLLFFICKIWRRYSRGRASQSLPKSSKQLEGTLEKTAKGLGKAPGAKAPLAKAPGAKAPAGKAPLAAKAGKGAGKGAGPPLSEDQVHSDPYTQI